MFVIMSVAHARARYVLAFGHGNAYWVGNYTRANYSFVPKGVTQQANTATPDTAPPASSATNRQLRARALTAASKSWINIK